MNKYEILGVVGEGVYGVVLKCRQRDTGEIVAIKKFKDSEDEEMNRKAIIREVKILKLLKHENIVQLKEALHKKQKHRFYLVFEFVEKNILEILEENQNGLKIEIVQSYIHQLCKAIQYIHAKDIIHRDIKPENLLTSSDNTLKLCDFGFARQIPTHKNSMMTDYVATRWYRAPELLLNLNYDKPVDMWAIACIMGELVDGQPLFPGESEMDQLFLIQKLLGEMNEQQKEAFAKNPSYIGYKFPEIHRPETLDRHYAGKLPLVALDFMKKLLQHDPDCRLDANQALQHPWLTGQKELALTYEPSRVQQIQLKNKRREKPQTKIQFEDILNQPPAPPPPQKNVPISFHQKQAAKVEQTTFDLMRLQLKSSKVDSREVQSSIQKFDMHALNNPDTKQEIQWSQKKERKIRKLDQQQYLRNVSKSPEKIQDFFPQIQIIKQNQDKPKFREDNYQAIQGSSGQSSKRNLF